VEKFMERLAVSKQTKRKIYIEGFNLNKLNELDGKKQYCVEILNRFAALENLDPEVNSRQFTNISDPNQASYVPFTCKFVHCKQ
jgi:hypothetical protein